MKNFRTCCLLEASAPNQENSSRYVKMGLGISVPEENISCLLSGPVSVTLNHYPSPCYELQQILVDNKDDMNSTFRFPWLFFVVLYVDLLRRQVLLEKKSVDTKHIESKDKKF